MPENLIDQIHHIEQDADRIVSEAHDEAARIAREADSRIEQYKAELEKKYEEEAAAIKARVEEERAREEAALREKAQAVLEQVRNLDVKGSAELINRIVERISTS